MSHGKGTKPKPDQIVALCLSRRANEISLDEFGQRLLAMLEDPDAVENIAIDVETLALQVRMDHG